MSYTFGSFSFEPKLGLLLRDGVPLPLGRRGAALLTLLLESRGRVIGKNSLVEAAWPGLTIEDSNLTVQIAKLRRLIGDERIRTVERVGYQWITPTPVGSSVARREVMPTPRVAIGAFVATNGERNDEFESELTTALVPFSSLTIATSPDIARYVLRGTLRILGEGSRINAQLIDTDSGTHLWARAFTVATPADIEAAAGAIAAGVESRIHLHEMAHHLAIAPAPGEAYDLYLRGRARQLSSEVHDNAAAYAFHTEALALDPENPLILSAAAEALHHRTAVGWPQLTSNDRGTATELARRLLESSDVDGVSVGLVGNTLMTSGEEDWGLALSRRGAELNPNSPLALMCAGLAELWADNLETAERILARATLLDPGDPTQRFVYETRARVALMRGEPERGLELAHRALAISSKISQAYWSVIEANDALGRPDHARRAYAAYHSISPDVTLSAIAAGQPFARQERLAATLAAARRAGMPER